MIRGWPGGMRVGGLAVLLLLQEQIIPDIELALKGSGVQRVGKP